MIWNTSYSALHAITAKNHTFWYIKPFSWFGFYGIFYLCRKNHGNFLFVEKKNSSQSVETVEKKRLTGIRSFKLLLWFHVAGLEIAEYWILSIRKHLIHNLFRFSRYDVGQSRNSISDSVTDFAPSYSTMDRLICEIQTSTRTPNY